MKLSKSQSYKIQIIRGLAIIAVVFIHNTPGGLAQVWCRPFLNFSVGAFLFLSGMLSNAGCWNPGKRILKVAIPYVLWTLIYVISNNMQSISSIPTAYVKALVTANSAPMMYYIPSNLELIVADGGYSTASYRKLLVPFNGGNKLWDTVKVKCNIDGIHICCPGLQMDWMRVEA